MIDEYLKRISDVAARGDAREESYYSAVESLFQQYAAQNSVNASVTILPKKTEAGNPDFRIWDGSYKITGYIEAKRPSENLDKVERSEQLKRYRDTFPNLILTDFYEFRLYRNGAPIDRVVIASNLEKIGVVPPSQNEDEFFSLLEKFFAFSLPAISNAEDLSVQLAVRTKFLRDEVIKQELKNAHIQSFFKSFETYLIKDLKPEDFANLYSQTITYGLFAARIRMKGKFNRRLAYENIPPTIGILRDVFQFISLGELPQQMEWIVDDIAEVVSAADVDGILNEYFKRGRGKDPVVHFYETFLANYDPETRERRGVYYTPESVVSYIVRSMHKILADKFGKTDGFADGSVTVLDPAAGTLTFLAKAAEVAVQEFTDNYGKGGRKKFIKERILENYHAFELMMAPYAIGHLKMSILLEQYGYKLTDKDRFKLYLTNTLDDKSIEQTDIPGIASISEESALAEKVKKKQPILAILGNPPYSGHSANKGEWIKNLIKDCYQKVDGKPLGEKNPKWLQDDYVKFIRFAQWKIEQAGEGVLGFITNHSYIDNPTFRGMRKSLMETFNEIYILDLHGSNQKKGSNPDESKDENVFDIQQGTAIAFFIKKAGVKECSVFHHELWGKRAKKYNWLEQNDISETQWESIEPRSKFYLFRPQSEENADYEKYPSIAEIFPVNSVGIVTARDSLTIRWSENDMWNTVSNFSTMDTEEARKAYGLGKDAKDWKVGKAQQDLIQDGPKRSNIAPVSYRPFDTRFTYYTGKSQGFICRPRKDVMKNMLEENLGLVVCRQVKTSPNYCHSFVTNLICESCLVSNKTSEISYCFPLYLYNEDLFDNGGESKPNIDTDFYTHINSRYKKTVTLEQIFHYTYAVLYSNTYREKYAEFLKMDFPRIPFAKDHKVFLKMSKIGEKLVALHLLKDPSLNKPKVKFEGKGLEKVETNIPYEKGKVYINANCYFKSVSSEVWEYMIGGYQVCSKWLKDRQGRHLSVDEIETYCKLATAIGETIKLQKKVDEVYKEVEND